MNELTVRFSHAVESDTLIQLVISHPAKNVSPAPTANDETDTSATVEKVLVRPVDLKSGRHLQFTFSEARRETHRNLMPEEAASEVERLLAGCFRRGHLYTTDFDFTVRIKASGKVRTHEYPPSKKRVGPTDHNRQKHYLIPEGAPCAFLERIGVMNSEGTVRRSKFDKFKQINRYLELVQDIYGFLPQNGPIQVVDFGCGKSYLTFALHHLLHRIHGRKVDIVGLDLKEDVVAHCNEIAKELHCHGLRFESGDMAGYSPLQSVDLSVSLHACDTATDLALSQAVNWDARVIFAVPCCHHEVASILDAGSLSSVMRRGILKERFAELLTDAMRADILEACGYRTQVLEFISLEHTPRNVLIRAIRDTAAGRTETPVPVPDSLRKTRETVGLSACTLEKLLTEVEPATTGKIADKLREYPHHDNDPAGP